MFLSGIDIGGTSIKFGIFDEQLNLLQQIYGPAAPALPQNPVGNFYQCSGPPQERYACWSSPHSPHPDFHRPDAFREIPFSR